MSELRVGDSVRSKIRGWYGHVMEINQAYLVRLLRGGDRAVAH